MDAWLITDTHLGHDALIKDNCRPAGFFLRIIQYEQVII